MSRLQNDSFIRALLRQPVERTPIWVMRQAGRYLPEYREIRQRVPNFMTLCQSPELACEVTLQPLARFDLDAAIIFSDILTIPDAMGLGLHFTPGEGPAFERPVRQAAEIEKLIIPDADVDLGYVMKAIQYVKQELAGKIPLIGFSGSPWTLACYMVEGRSNKDFPLAKKMLYQSPDTLHALLNKLAESVIQYLNAQIAAGADAVMIFDTWGGLLSGPDYHQFSLAYMQKIIEGLSKTRDQQTIPSIIFSKNAGQWLESMANIGCQGIGLDWTMDIGQARQRVGDKVALQGNLDPSVMLTDPATIERKALDVLQQFGPHPGHVFNLGHGITPQVPVEHMQVLVDTVHGDKQHGTGST